mgnify:CR=1 FL=1
MTVCDMAPAEDPARNLSNAVIFSVFLNDLISVFICKTLQQDCRTLARGQVIEEIAEISLFPLFRRNIYMYQYIYVYLSHS